MTDVPVRAAAGPAAPTPGAHSALHPLGLGAVRITGGLWAARQAANRAVSIPQGAQQLDRAGNLRDLEILAGEAEGEAIGPIFADSDVHKWLEAVACELPWSHEHYCAGHLLQAAVAQVRATGHRELLDVATMLADHLVATFGDGRPGLGDRQDVDGHPVVETALVELYRETGTRAYLDLAQYLVEARGHGLMQKDGKEPTSFSDRVPVRETPHPEGHAVRAVYLAAGATDVAVETGDTELLAALGRPYAAMERSQQYLTGGLGARWEGESFGDPFELPADRATPRRARRSAASSGPGACVAIERGPLVYALEQPDQVGGVVVDDVRLDPTAPITIQWRPDLLGGTAVLHAAGQVVAGPDQRAATGTPYRALRGPQAMRVWIPLV